MKINQEFGFLQLLISNFRNMLWSLSAKNLWSQNSLHCKWNLSSQILATVPLGLPSVSFCTVQCGVVDWLYLINRNQHYRIHNGCTCAAVTIFHDLSWKCVPIVALNYRRFQSEMACIRGRNGLSSPAVQCEDCIRIIRSEKCNLVLEDRDSTQGSVEMKKTIRARLSQEARKWSQVAAQLDQESEDAHP